jgi:pumilio family protein 6
VDGTSKDKLPALLAHVQGSVRTLAKHPVGSQVLESLYFPAPPAQKKSMEVEFYGAEYALFGAAGDGTGATAVKSLKEAMLRKPVAQRQGMLRQMNAALLPILEKGLVSPSIIHKVLAEYLDVGGPGTKFEAAHSLAGPAFLRMVHTREGAHAVNLMLTHAGAKQRKAVLKALKGQVGRIVRDEHASVAVMCMLDSVDDTQLLAKVIVAELRQEGLAELAEDRAARRVLLHLLRPRSTRYVHPHVLATLPDPAAVAAAVESSKLALTAGGHQVGEVGDEAEEADAADGDDADMEDGVEDDEEMDEEMMDDEFDDEEEEADRKPTSQMTKQKSNAALAGGDDDDDDEAGGGGGDSVDFGISRKPQEARRREIFSAPGHLGRSLVASCIGAAGGMLRSAVASDVLLEVCSGGAGGVVTASVGADQLGELHAAVAEAVRASVAGEERVEEEEEEGKGKGKEPLHTDYFSTRTLRRMVLEIPGGGDATAAGGDGPVAPCFAAALWEGAVAHDPAAWVGGHGAKVLAAIIRAGDAATKQEAAAAVQKIVKDKTPQEWAAGFFRHEDAKQGDGAGVKGAKKAKQGGSAGGAKGPGAAKGASTAKADKGVKGATPAKADRATTPAKTPKGDKAPKASTPQVTAEVEEKSATKTAGKKARAAAAAAAEVEAGEKTPVVVKSGLSVKTAKTTAGKGSKGEGGKSPKSPKELKFSPRLTRAQRVEKAAKEAAK